MLLQVLTSLCTKLVWIYKFIQSAVECIVYVFSTKGRTLTSFSSYTRRLQGDCTPKRTCFECHISKLVMFSIFTNSHRNTQKYSLNSIYNNPHELIPLFDSLFGHPVDGCLEISLKSTAQTLTHFAWNELKREKEVTNSTRSQVDFH